MSLSTRIDGGERVTGCWPTDDRVSDFGQELAGLGDVDGDGYADFAVATEDVSSWDCEFASGGAFLFRGPLTGEHSVFEAFGVVLGRPVPPPYGDGAGQALAGGEDLTGDGVPDLLVGASLMNEEGFEAGGAILVSGDLSSTDIGGDTRLYGAAESDSTGLEVAFVGDVTGDGLPDIAVASASHDLRGVVYIVPGPVGAGTYALLGSGPLLVGAEGDGARAPSGGGDLNGDGYADIAVRASGNDEAGTSYGAVYVVFGPVAGEVDLSTADAKWLGESIGHLSALAPSLLTDADVNGDGHDDLVIGASTAEVGGLNPGAVHVVFGPLSPGVFSLASADLEWRGEADSDGAGYALAGLGDVDGDGRDEIAVGAPGDSSGGIHAGAVYVIDGAMAGHRSLADAERKIYGTVAEAWAGEHLAAAGDVNGDGHMDLLVGATGFGNIHGSVYLVPGGPGGML
ncbi:integrin alpha [Myxococcota bacterium]|nr:integrin alpha [Myxococcota bacterium]